MFAKRDVFALLLSCFAVYYSTLSEGVVSFHPAFVVARDGGPGETAWDAPSGFLSGRFDGRSAVDDPTDNRNANKRDDHPPPPKFFDLNGDGVREMLVATGGGASGDEPGEVTVVLETLTWEAVTEHRSHGTIKAYRWSDGDASGTWTHDRDKAILDGEEFAKAEDETPNADDLIGDILESGFFGPSATEENVREILECVEDGVEGFYLLLAQGVVPAKPLGRLWTNNGYLQVPHICLPACSSVGVAAHTLLRTILELDEALHEA